MSNPKDLSLEEMKMMAEPVTKGEMLAWLQTFSDRLRSHRTNTQEDITAEIISSLLTNAFVDSTFTSEPHRKELQVELGLSSVEELKSVARAMAEHRSGRRG
jgi:hypothetical protein